MVIPMLNRQSGRVLKNLFQATSKRNGSISPAIQNLILKKEDTNLIIRGFQTSALRLNEEQPKVQTKVMTVTNPIKYISLKIKMLLMRGYFDDKFSEKDFLTGARQAIVYVSSKMAKGDMKDLTEVLTQEGSRSVQNLFSENRDNSEVLKVEDSDIMTLTLNDIGFEYGESGRKWAYALVVCYCSGKDSFSKQASDFDFEILVSQPRIIKYSFCREYTPGTSHGWLVDQVDHLNLSGTKE